MSKGKVQERSGGAALPAHALSPGVQRGGRGGRRLAPPSTRFPPEDNATSVLWVNLAHPEGEGGGQDDDGAPLLAALRDVAGAGAWCC
jgi:hypothetical protein